MLMQLGFCWNLFGLWLCSVFFLQRHVNWSWVSPCHLPTFINVARHWFSYRYLCFCCFHQTFDPWSQEYPPKFFLRPSNILFLKWNFLVMETYCLNSGKLGFWIIFFPVADSCWMTALGHLRWIRTIMNLSPSPLCHAVFQDHGSDGEVCFVWKLLDGEQQVRKTKWWLLVERSWSLFWGYCNCVVGICWDTLRFVIPRFLLWRMMCIQFLTRLLQICLVKHWRR